MKENSCFDEHNARNWDDVEEFHGVLLKQENNRQLIFRGQKTRIDQQSGEQSPYLRTKLDEAFDRFGPDEKDDQGKCYSRKELERALVREFQRKASLYIPNPPPADDILQWLALMQHHGAPTRLLDWIYSFYVAVYFAVAELDCINNKASSTEIWAMNTRLSHDFAIVEKEIRKRPKWRNFKRLRQQFMKQKDALDMNKDKLEDNAVIAWLMENRLPLIYAVNPYTLNQRLAVQRGVFLCSGDINVPFYDNLRAFGSDSVLKKSLYRLTIRVEMSSKNEILRKLGDMNISNAVLFPDLDGFAKSLWEKLASPETFGLKKKKPATNE